MRGIKGLVLKSWEVRSFPASARGDEPRVPRAQGPERSRAIQGPGFRECGGDGIRQRFAVLRKRADHGEPVGACDDLGRCDRAHGLFRCMSAYACRDFERCVASPSPDGLHGHIPAHRQRGYNVSRGLGTTYPALIINQSRHSSGQIIIRALLLPIKNSC